MCAGKKWLKAQIRTHVSQFLLAQTGGCHSVNTSAAQVSSRQRERTGVKRARCAWWDTHKSSACISAIVMHAGSRRTGAGALRYSLRSWKNEVRNNESSACISALVMHAGSRKAGIAKTRWRRNDAVCSAFQRAFQMWRCRPRSPARTARRQRLASTVATCWVCRSCSVDVRA